MSTQVKNDGFSIASLFSAADPNARMEGESFLQYAARMEGSSEDANKRRLREMKNADFAKAEVASLEHFQAQTTDSTQVSNLAESKTVDKSFLPAISGAPAGTFNAQMLAMSNGMGARV